MVENFKYESLKSNPPPSVPGGDFAYEQSSSGVINEVQEGAFNYEHSKTTVYENLLGWFIIPWFGDWFGDEVFKFEHQTLKKLALPPESNFEFENLKPIVSPVISNNDFKYKRF